MATSPKAPVEETTLIKQKKVSWTRKDKFLFTFVLLVHLGDGMEVYLPGVVGQQISCDIELSPMKEAILECIQYFTLAVAIIISGVLANKIGCRKLTLLSLYLSILSTVVCAIVANYTTLLLSRALIGFCVGLNFSTHCVMAARQMSNKVVLAKMVLVAGIMDNVGGVWAAVLGYFLLDVVGWRMFIVLTSLPLFIPAIVLLHFIKEDPKEDRKENTDTTLIKEDLSFSDFATRTFKLGIFGTIYTFQGWGSIILLPTMIQLLKIKDAGTAITDCSITVTQGAELLILALVTGAVILGQCFSHFARGKLSFRKSQVFIGLIGLTSFIVMSVQDSLPGVMLSNLLIKVSYGSSSMASSFIKYNVEYFGTTRYAMGCSICRAMSSLGGLVGTATLAFTSVSVIKISGLVLSVLQIMLVLSMTEVQQL